MSTPDPHPGSANQLDPERIGRSTFLGDVVFFDTHESTSDLALQQADRFSTGPPVLFLTAQQTAGRGRGTNRWWAGRGSLTFSLLVNTSAAAARRPALALATTLAILDAVNEHLPKEIAATSGLKWPNDVLLGTRKISGVLVENVAGSTTLVIGIGINVNNEIPDDLAESATSLAEAAGRPCSLTELLIDVIDHFEENLVEWSSESPRLAERWQAAHCYTGQSVEVAAPHGRFSGTCREIDELGRLVLVPVPAKGDQDASPIRLSTGTLMATAESGS